MDPTMTTVLPQHDAPDHKPEFDSEVVAVARRRTFTKGYMRCIVQEANACTQTGAIGAVVQP
ncbi:MAG: hypothetical protein H7335_04255 [Massilia sp.]|nr:hypothetical protein [Massilia sp.]